MFTGCQHSSNNDEESHRDDTKVVSAYYDFFDKVTSDGRVFTEDLSSHEVFRTALTPEEGDTRTAYASTVQRLQLEYMKSKCVHPVATTKEEVLQQRVVAPCLVSINVSSRSDNSNPRGCRMYPENIHPWHGFRESVEGYNMKEDTSLLHQPIENIFLSSLQRAGTECGDEMEEQQHLISMLDQTLKQAGIIHSIECFTNLVGKLDYWTTSANEGNSIICLCKSTHNLQLPMSDDECANAYNAASVYGTKDYRRSTVWSNVGHPIGQLLYCMIENKHRYGALTSGTRTYFLKIQGPGILSSNVDPSEQKQSAATNHITTRSQAKKMKTSDANENRDVHVDGDSLMEGGDEIQVYISDGWCVGENNYLRAWAYMHSWPASTYPWKDPTNWITMPPPKSDSIYWDQLTYIAKPHGKIKKTAVSESGLHCTSYEYHEQLASTCNMVYYYPLHQGALVYVPFEDLKIVNVLGEGRCGSCFRVKWNEIVYAMKQYDTGKRGDMSYVKEISAYMLLQDVWGILVPRPMFLSESFSGNVLFLGLQLGRESNKDDDIAECKKIVKRLEKEYCIRHNDAAYGHNTIRITDTDGVERVAVIDFEDWDEVQH